MYSVEKVRKETILELDTFLKNKEDNKIVELSDKLFSLDLTMYSKNNNLKSLCYNAFALSTLDDKISLHPSQIEILNVISENKASIISAPTSFGKTFCIFEHINIYKPNIVVLIVPTLALIDEYKTKIIKKYKNNFAEYKIYTSISKNKEYNFSNKNMFILTHDKIVQDNSYELLEKIDFLAIDEIYKLERKNGDNDDRTLILNMAYYYLSKKAERYVLLAPFIKGVKNTEILDKNPYFYSSTYSPVVNNIEFCEIEKDIPKYRYNMAKKIDDEINKNEKTLIYFGTVRDLNKYIEKFIITKSPISDIEEEIKNFINWAKEEIHEEWNIIKAMERGYLVHHGKIPLGIRIFQLNCYEKSNNYSRLLCTSTLLEGVNTTAQNIIIVKAARTEKFSAFDFFNLVGRTGRLLKHLIGTAYYIKSPTDVFYNREDANISIEFEVTTSSEDINFQKGNYDKCPNIKKLIETLKINHEEYKDNIGFKLRSETVIKLYDSYLKYEEILIDSVDNFICKPPKPRTILIEPLYYICTNIQDTKNKKYILSVRIACINSLINRNRPKLKECIRKVLDKYPNWKNINTIISYLIEFKNGYIEHEFYKRISIILFFMKARHLPEKYIETIKKEILEVIELLFYSKSPSKKLLYDMGFYEKDIDNIIEIINDDFDDINDLKERIKMNREIINDKVSYISKYIINTLLET